MTVEIATTAPNNLPALLGTPGADALARLADWAASMSHVAAVVGPLIGTPFVPLIDNRGQRRDRDQVEAEAVGKVLYGLSLGWDPLTSLQQIILIPGRAPSMYAKAKVAQLLSRGYRIRVVELTETSCTMAGARPGAEHEETVTVTMADAERGEWGKSNDNYRKNPKDMLHWRAAGRLCDQIGADALMGLATTEDEADLPPITVDAVAGPALAAPVKLAQFAQTPAETPSDRAPDPDDEPGQQPISGPQSKKLHTLLGRTGRGERAEGLRYLTLFLGREITTSKELTRVEANRVIADLEAQAEAPGPQAEPDSGDWPAVAQAPLEP